MTVLTLRIVSKKHLEESTIIVSYLVSTTQFVTFFMYRNHIVKPPKNYSLGNTLLLCLGYAHRTAPCNNLSCDSNLFLMILLFLKFFIVIQLQLYTFSPHPSTPPQPNPPPSPTSTLPLDFVHVSFIVVPVIPSPLCPLPTPPWLLLDCS